LVDTGDGVAISFLANPEDALFVALALWRALSTPAGGKPIAVRTGINFGKVSVQGDINGQPSVIGDGINMAQRVMCFANPGQLLVSRTFHQVLVGLSEDYAGMFAYCGSRTDKHVREHELYEFAMPLDRMSQIELPRFMLPAPAAAAPDPAPPAAQRTDLQPSSAPRRRAALLAASATLAISLAFAAHTLAPRPAAEAKPPPSEALGPAPAPPAETQRLSPTSDKPRTRPRAATPAKRPSAPAPVLADHEPPVAPRAAVPSDEFALAALPDAADDGPSAAPADATEPGTLAFAIAPWGEVVVDGRSYGASPPLTHLPLPAGEHQVEVRNGVSDPYRTIVRLEAGQSLRIRHSFEGPRPD
jgi:hypothetical protein